MANTITITKESVTKDSNGIYTINVRCVVNDGTVDIFDKIVSAKYNPNVATLDSIKADMWTNFTKQWDKYVAEQFVLNSTKFDTAITDMQPTATAYVNT